MRLSAFSRAVAGLSVTQVLAWGCVYYPVSVTGPRIAADLGVSLETIFGAYSGLLIASAVVAPAVGRAIDRRGGRLVLGLGSVVAALGLAATACVGGPWGYGLCSVALGVAAAMTLYDAAFPALVQATQPHGRRAITIVTFAGGFASTLCWPATAFLADRMGWRATYLVFALVMLAVCLPVNVAALARPGASPPVPTPTPPRDAGEAELQGADRPRAFLLLAGAVAANQFVASGFLIHTIDYMTRIGLTPAQGVALGMLFGPAQVLGRVGEMAFGRRFSAVTTGRLAAALLPLGLVPMVPAGESFAPAAAFVVALGLSNGLMTIARGTVTLALFGPVGYGAMVGRLTVPTLAARAAGPFAFALAIQAFGPRTTAVAGLALALLGVAGMEALAALARRAARENVAARSPA